ncbi:MAG: AAA family ATPase [Kiritimatiellia bacterium]
MKLATVTVKNWMNFQELSEVPLHTRNYVIGANAVGKSNFLDIFRFLRDVASPAGARPSAGGLQEAINRRDGIRKLRCLHGRKDSEVLIDVTLKEGQDSWRYVLGFKGEGKANNRVLIRQEKVFKNGQPLPQCQRPDAEDKKDSDRLTVTYLENPNANKEFRLLAHYLSAITYLHLVPQLLKHGDEIGGNRLSRDPFGQGFLQRVAETNGKTQGARLKRIQEALSKIVPEFRELSFEQDSATGAPHLRVNFKHWRSTGAYQRETQFSDGTLRLIGLLWSLMEGDSLLLLEEPELSLNEEIVRKLHKLIPHILKLGKYADRQVIVTTHSESLLSDLSIGAESVLRFVSTDDGTVLKPASDKEAFMLKSGFSVGQALLPAVKPKGSDQLLQGFE